MHLIKDPALPAGIAQAFDAEGKLLATLKLPLKGLVPKGTVTVRVSAEDYERMVGVINGIGDEAPPMRAGPRTTDS